MTNIDSIEHQIAQLKESLKILQSSVALMNAAMQDGINVNGALGSYASYAASIDNLDQKVANLKEIL